MAQIALSNYRCFQNYDKKDQWEDFLNVAVKWKVGYLTGLMTTQLNIILQLKATSLFSPNYTEKIESKKNSKTTTKTLSSKEKINATNLWLSFFLGAAFFCCWGT